MFETATVIYAHSKCLETKVHTHPCNSDKSIIYKINYKSIDI